MCMLEIFTEKISWLMINIEPSCLLTLFWMGFLDHVFGWGVVKTALYLNSNWEKLESCMLSKYITSALFWLRHQMFRKYLITSVGEKVFTPVFGKWKMQEFSIAYFSHQFCGYKVTWTKILLKIFKSLKFPVVCHG